jgi:hypothetical protein
MTPAQPALDAMMEGVTALSRRIRTRPGYLHPIEIAVSEFAREVVFLGQGDFPTVGEIAATARVNMDKAADLLDTLAAEVRAQREAKDGAYLERNKLVALLAWLYPSGIKRTAIEGWSEDWHGCVYIDFPWGQASWHYHDSHAGLFEHLPPYAGEWNGHTTEAKYDSIVQASRAQRETIAGLEEELKWAKREVEGVAAHVIAFSGENTDNPVEAAHRMASTIAGLEARVEALTGVLQWCSGSPDFNEGGQAREGWLRVCAPLLKGDTPNG